MHRTIYKIFIYLTVSLSIGLFSCHRHTVPSSSVLQSPAFQWFLKGHAYLQQNEYIQAEIAFNRALTFQRNFAPALNGLAQVYLAQNHLDLARQYVQLALQGKPPFLPTRLTEVRLLIRNGEYQRAQEKLRAVAYVVQKKKLQVLQEPLWYYSALVAYKENRLSEADSLLKTLLKHNPRHAKAQALADSLHQRQAAIKDISQAARPFAFKPFITRADLATLLHIYFGSTHFERPLPLAITRFYPTLPFSALTDINRQAPQAKWIDEALRNGLLWCYPDGTFRPKATVSRGEFALVLQRIYLRSQAFTSVKTTCFSPIDDVPEEDFIFPAVCLAIQNHWLALQGKAFNPHHKIKGLVAVQALQKLGAAQSHGKVRPAEAE